MTTPTPAQRSDHKDNNLTAQPYNSSKMAVYFIIVSGQQNAVVSPHERPFRCFYESVRVRNNTVGTNGESSYEPKKCYLCTLAIFCGGYVTNTLLDSAVEAAQAYFHLHTSNYKTDSSDYIICSREKPNDNLMPLTLNAWGE